MILTIDTSKSMEATDVLPSRLEAAKRAATAFLEEIPDSVPGRYRLVLPRARPSSCRRRSTARSRVRRSTQLRPGTGTAIGDAIDRSLEIAVRATRTAQPVPAAASDRPPRSSPPLGRRPDAGQAAVPAPRSVPASFGVPVSTVALGTSDATVEVTGPDGLTERVIVPPDKPDAAPDRADDRRHVLRGDRRRAPRGGLPVARDASRRASRSSVELTSAFAGAARVADADRRRAVDDLVPEGVVKRRRPHARRARARAASRARVEAAPRGRTSAGACRSACPSRGRGSRSRRRGRGSRQLGISAARAAATSSRAPTRASPTARSTSRSAGRTARPIGPGVDRRRSVLFTAVYAGGAPRDRRSSRSSAASRRRAAARAA